MTYDPSPTLEAFIAAEHRNADEGGDPVTLQSVRDSLAQMPSEVLAELNPDVAAAGADRDGLMAEIDAMVARLGRDYEPD